MADSTTRRQTTIDLTEESLTRLETFISRRGGHGMKKAILSRLVEWFVAQSGPIQAMVSGWLDDQFAPIAAMELRAMADRLEGKSTAASAAAKTDYAGDTTSNPTAELPAQTRSSEPSDASKPAKSHRHKRAEDRQRQSTGRSR